MAMNNLQDLFTEELNDMYDAEQRITKALPQMAKEAASEELSSAFEEHLEQTREHIARLERVFKMIGESPAKKTCEGMVGLLEEGEEIMKKNAPESVQDAALIAAAQKVEHYEMATYGCLRDWARLLGQDEAADVLQETLDEEGDTDKRLTEIAQTLNVDAMEGEDEEEGDEEEIERDEPVSAARRAAGPNRPSGSRPRSRMR